MDITYKTALPKIEEYMPLFESTGWNSVYGASKDEIVNAISNSTFTVSAYSSGKLIGFGRIVSDNVLYAVIYDVIVAPSYQKKGIGKNIVINLLQYCKSKNIRDIQLFSAQGTISFYEKLGFKQRPTLAPGMRYVNGT